MRYGRRTRADETCPIHDGTSLLFESTLVNFCRTVTILQVVLGTTLFISHARLLACRGAQPLVAQGRVADKVDTVRRQTRR